MEIADCGGCWINNKWTCGCNKLHMENCPCSQCIIKTACTRLCENFSTYLNKQNWNPVADAHYYANREL